jgi:hypothetical protein
MDKGDGVSDGREANQYTGILATRNHKVKHRDLSPEMQCLRIFIFSGNMDEGDGVSDGREANISTLVF